MLARSASVKREMGLALVVASMRVVVTLGDAPLVAARPMVQITYMCCSS